MRSGGVSLLLKSPTRGACVGTLLVLACLAGEPTPAAAQQPVTAPSPLPENLDQDAIDFRGRVGLAIGSGARAYGMGGAFLARADDATAASWNPAGLSYLRQPEFSLVLARNSVDSLEFRTGVVDELERPVETTKDNKSLSQDVDFAAVTYPLRIGTRLGSAQLSFQRVISFSGERTLETRNVTLTGTTPIESVDATRAFSGTGGFDVVALGTGFRVSQRLRLGATVNRWFNGYAQVVQRGEPRLSTQHSNLLISGWNANAGLMWSPFESLNIGVVGKTPFTADVILSRMRRDTFLATRVLPEVVTGSNLRRGDLTLDFPAAVGGGASWRPHDQLTVSVDYTRTLWSRGRIHNYFTLPATQRGQTPPTSVSDLREGVDSFVDLPYPIFDEDDQSDSEQLRAGAELVIIRGRFKMPVRIGYFTDRQIFRDEHEGPPTFQGVTAGAGLILGPVLLDAAVLHEWGDYTQVFQRGTIENMAITPITSLNDVKATRVLMSISYRHGGNR
jgi:hypothetical protein